MKRKVIASVFLLLMFFALLSACASPAPGNTSNTISREEQFFEGTEDLGPVTADSKDTIVEKYVVYLSDEKIREYAVEKNYLFSKDPGEDSDISWHNIVQSGDNTASEPADKENTDNYAKNWARIAENQSAFIKEQFGEKALENVSYELIPCISTVTTPAYYLVDSGEEINRETYDKLYKEFWTDIAEKAGLTYEDLHKVQGEAPAEVIIKCNELMWDNRENCPVKMGSKGVNEAYRVVLAFYDKTASENYGDFHFVVEEIGKKWSVSSGLRWEYVGPEEIGD